MALGKDRTRIRFNSGNNFQIKFGSPTASWKNLGELVSGNLEDNTDTSTIVFSDGDSFEVKTLRKVKLSVTLAQTSKEEIELIDVLRDGFFEAYYDNGLVGGKYQEFYFKQINVIPKIKLEMKGNAHQVLEFEMNVIKQPTIVEVIPDTGLPEDAHASGTTPVAGKNNYYVILETPS